MNELFKKQLDIVLSYCNKSDLYYIHGKVLKNAKSGKGKDFYLKSIEKHIHK